MAISKRFTSSYAVIIFISGCKVFVCVWKERRGGEGRGGE